MGADTVRALWTGGPITVFEELSIRSFVENGHDVEVYSYDAECAVPDGSRLCDANEIIPEKDVFRYTSGAAKGSLAAFSNLFRFRLLYEKGGIWSDLDVLCIRNLSDLPDACAGKVNENWMNGAVLKFPKKHPVCLRLLEKLELLGESILLGQTAGEITRQFNDAEDAAVLPVDAFYPISADEAWRLIDPDQAEYCASQCADAYAVHWWNTVFEFGMRFPKEKLPPVGSYLHGHASRYLNRSGPAIPAAKVKPLVKPYKHLAAARREARRRKWHLAAEEWRSALRSFRGRETPDVWLGLSRALRLNGELGLAGAAAMKGCAKFSEDLRLASKFSVEIAEISIAEEDWAGAIDALEQAITQDASVLSCKHLKKLMQAYRNAGDEQGAASVPIRFSTELS